MRGESEQKVSHVVHMSMFNVKKRKIQQIHTSYACSTFSTGLLEIGTVVISRMSFGRSSGNSFCSLKRSWAIASNMLGTSTVLLAFRRDMDADVMFPNPSASQ